MRPEGEMGGVLRWSRHSLVHLQDLISLRAPPEGALPHAQQRGCPRAQGLAKENLHVPLQRSSTRGLAGARAAALGTRKNGL